MILNQFKLDGKVALVTGARTGIGQAMALALAQAGADIIGVGSGAMPETIEKIHALGRVCHTIQADLTQMASIQTVMDAVNSKFGRADILVNNAGIIRREDAINFTEKAWDDVMNINLKVLFFLSQAVARGMIERKTGGRIINIASMLSFQGGIRVPSYTASKSGLMGLTKLMTNEWAKYGITVNAIAPGYISTDNTALLRSDPKRYEEILSRIPEGRWGEPEDLMGAAVFLASDASTYVNGHTLTVDGGWLAR